MFTEHATEFGGFKVVEFENARNWRGPLNAYRVHAEFEDTDFFDKLEALASSPGARELAALVVGAWDGSCEGTASTALVEWLVKNASRLPQLRALFLGDIVYEECELSWIKQTDMGPLLAAFPQLESLRVRGSDGLAFSRVNHAALRSLIVESGGLPRDVLRQIFQCELPNLEHFEVLLGDPGYGWDGDVEDLQPLLSGRLYPRLRRLGLKDSEIEDDIAAAVVNSPLVKRIEMLDLSQGNLTARGARSLLSLPNDGTLKRVDISFHYVPNDVVEELRAGLPCELIADDPQDPNDEFRSILHAE